MRSADAGNAKWKNLSAFRDECRKHPGVLVVDVIDFLDAELANLLAAEVLTLSASSAALAGRATGPSVLRCHKSSFFFLTYLWFPRALEPAAGTSRRIAEASLRSEAGPVAILS
jgi:hypothetical protein